MASIVSSQALASLLLSFFVRLSFWSFGPPVSHCNPFPPSTHCSALVGAGLLLYLPSSPPASFATYCLHPDRSPNTITIKHPFTPPHSPRSHSPSHPPTDQNTGPPKPRPTLPLKANAHAERIQDKTAAHTRPLGFGLELASGVHY